MDVLCKEEESLSDELSPIAFVSVSPVSTEGDTLHDLPNVSCVHDPLILNPVMEGLYNSNMTQIINVKKEREFLSSSEIKLEITDDLSTDETISPMYSENGKGEVEIKFESVCDISESNFKKEEPIETCLGLEDEENELKEKREILKRRTKKSSFIGYHQDVNKKLGAWNANQQDKKDSTVVTEVSNAPYAYVLSGNNNLAIDKICGSSKPGKIPEKKLLKESSEKYPNWNICSQGDMFFYSKLYPSTLTSKNYQEELVRSPCSETKKFSWNISRASFNSTEKLKRCSGTYIPEIRFPCSICTISFSKKSNLDTHMQNHCVEEHFNCGICEKTFSENSYVCKHMPARSEDMRYACDICKKSFSAKYNFNRHMQTHTGHKPYQCSICEKSFSDKSYLPIHMRSHTGHKPYQCSFCEQSFSNKCHLTNHVRTHTGHKPYHCSICEKSFSHKSNLPIHMRSHTGHKPYQCSFCEKSYSHKSHLTIHVRTHTGHKPYECGICERSFSSKSILNNHLRTHTREEHPYN